jgi:5-methylcytosine-specific restriction endonuclease McrA
MRFDLPEGHDQGAAVELVVPDAGDDTLDNLRLCHRRCHASGADHTGEVTERMRRKNEAALFARSRGSESEAA